MSNEDFLNYKTCSGIDAIHKELHLQVIDFSFNFHDAGTLHKHMAQES